MCLPTAQARVLHGRATIYRPYFTMVVADMKISPSPAVTPTPHQTQPRLGRVNITSQDQEKFFMGDNQFDSSFSLIHDTLVPKSIVINDKDKFCLFYINFIKYNEHYYEQKMTQEMPLCCCVERYQQKHYRRLAARRSTFVRVDSSSPAQCRHPA